VPHFATTEIDITLAPAGLQESVNVTITLDAAGRTRFGERFTIRLVPR
jgi:hypothetical protein